MRSMVFGALSKTAFEDLQICQSGMIPATSALQGSCNVHLRANQICGDDRMSLKIVKGPHGVNKVFFHQVPTSKDLLVYFSGDQIYRTGVSDTVLRLQTPDGIVAALESACYSRPVSILIIEASRREAGSACYDHFLTKTTRTGEPLGYSQSSIKALEQLVALASQGAGWDVERFPVVKLAGFSKGGIVLNQLLVDIASTVNRRQVDNEILCFLGALDAVHYLDAGLNCRGAFLTDARAIECLGQWFALRKDQGKDNKEMFSIVLHITPRTASCQGMPWIRAERTCMVRLLRENGIPCREVTHFEGERGDTLDLHFRVHEAALDDDEQIQREKELSFQTANALQNI